MEFESPDVAKDFPGLYASENIKRSHSHDSDYSDDEKTARKDQGKKKEKKESKKDKGYVVFEGESSGNEINDIKSPGKSKKTKSTFKFPGKDKKEKHIKSKDKDAKDKEKVCKKESKDNKKETKEVDKLKVKKKKESKLLKIKDKKKKNTDVKDIKPVFGVPLSEVVECYKCHDDVELPSIVREWIDYIEEHGLAFEGIYRISGLKSKLRHLKDQYNKAEKVHLCEHEPHVVASLLKLFLRELPEPILTHTLISKFEEAAALKNEQRKVETLQKLLNDLPNCNRLLLTWIFIHMKHVIAMERRNKMNLQNVSIVLSPTMQISHNTLHAFFTHSNILFGGCELKKYAPPLELDSSRLSLELPDSPTAIAEELTKQENILSILHSELNSGLRDKQKDEQLWEVQRIVTQLKRKLRVLRQIQDTTDVRVGETETKTANDLANSFNGQNPSKSGTLLPKDVGIEDQKIPADFEPVKVKEVVEAKAKINGDCTNLENIQNCVLQENSFQNVKANLVKTDSLAAAFVPEESQIPCDIERKIFSNNEVGIFKTPHPQVFKSADENVNILMMEERMLRIENDELVLLGDELGRKIRSEKLEIDRLKMEINEYHQLHKYKCYSFDSTENSSSDSDDSSASDYNGEEEDLSSVLEDLLKKNNKLEMMNKDISKVIQHEREVCLNIKVQVKLLQKDIVGR